MDRVRPQNLAFLSADDDRQRLHVSTLGIYEGPAPLHPELIDRVKAALPLVPRFRQRVQEVPLRLGRPVWIDDDSFQAEHHVRHTSLPSPGTDAQLRELVGRLASNPLDRHHPLWELWQIDGLEDGQWALLSKSHQAIVDGVAGTPLLSVLLDSSATALVGPAGEWLPEPAPSDARLMADALTDLAVDPTELARAVRSGIRMQGAMVKWAFDRVSVPFRSPPDTDPAGLSGPIGVRRIWDRAEVSLDEIRLVRNVFGGSTHDVLLACFAAGFRNLLKERGRLAPESEVRAVVPLSIPGDDGRYENEVTVVEVVLPVGVEDALERYGIIADELAGSHKNGVAADVLASLAGNATPLMLALGTRMATAAARLQRHVQTIITNVPGPRTPRYLLGRTLIASYPVVPIVDGVRVAVGAASYLDTVWLGFTGDLHHCGDISALREGVVGAMAELFDLARGVDTGPAS
jgi:diacylglycerol O-acyltransferase / wax synthase